MCSEYGDISQVKSVAISETDYGPVHRYSLGMEKEWLKQALEHSGISQAELARELHKRFNWPDDRSAINKILKDRRRIKATEMVQISEITGFRLPESFNRPKKPNLKIVDSFDPDLHTPEIDDEWDGNGGGYVDGAITFQRTIEGSSPEFSAKPGMGPGQIDDRTARVVSNGIATGHPVVNEWFIPPAYVRNALDATPSQVMILPVIGHSMEPLLKSNDRVMVDVSQNVWMGDAVYIIDDGDGVLQAKTIKKVMSSSPPQYRIVSEASPDEAPIVRKHDEFRIVGRVVGRFTRM